MKRLFLMLCLLNIAFPLWLFHTGRFDIEQQKPVAPASILLVGEYARAERGAVISGFIDRRTQEKVEQWRQEDIQRILTDLTAEKRWWRMPFARPKPKKIVKPPVVKSVEEPVKPKPPAPVIELRCYEIGPFTEQLNAKQWLSETGLTGGQVIQKEGPVPSDYQVYYPAAKTAEQSKLDKIMLRDKGIQDIWLIPFGESKGAYSLGVFKDKQRAIILKNELAEKGVKAQIKQRDKTAAQWFARVTLDKAKLKQYQTATETWSSCSGN